MDSLKRSLGVKHGIAMSVGAVLGPGILVLPAITAQEAGPASLISWILMSFLAIFLALTLGRLGSKVTKAGGIVDYARSAFGVAIGRITGWLFLGTIPFTIPIIALVGANYVGSIFHLNHWVITGIAILMVYSSLLLNVRGVEMAGWVQVVIVSLIISLLLTAIITGASSMSYTSFHPFHPHGWASIGSAAVIIFWSYVGFEMVVHLAEEFKNPSRDLLASLGFASIIVSLVYLAVACVTIGTNSYGRNIGLAPLSLMVEKGLGPIAGFVTGIIAILCSFGTIHTNIAGFARLLYSQSRDGDLPKFFLKLHPRYQTPIGSFYGQAVVFACFLLYNGFFQPNLGLLIKCPSVTFLVLYMIAMLSALKLLPIQDIGWWFGLITFLVCLVLYPFTGWACLYPMALIVIGWAVSLKINRNSSLFSGKSK